MIWYFVYDGKITETRHKILNITDLDKRKWFRPIFNTIKSKFFVATKDEIKDKRNWKKGEKKDKPF